MRRVPPTVTIGGAASEVTVLWETELTAKTAAGTGEPEVVVSDAGGISTFGPLFKYEP